MVDSNNGNNVIDEDEILINVYDDIRVLRSHTYSKVIFQNFDPEDFTCQQWLHAAKRATRSTKGTVEIHFHTN